MPNRAQINDGCWGDLTPGPEGPRDGRGDVYFCTANKVWCRVVRATQVHAPGPPKVNINAIDTTGKAHFPVREARTPLVIYRATNL